MKITADFTSAVYFDFSFCTYTSMSGIEVDRKDWEQLPLQQKENGYCKMYQGNCKLFELVLQRCLKGLPVYCSNDIVGWELY